MSIPVALCRPLFLALLLSLPAAGAAQVSREGDPTPPAAADGAGPEARDPLDSGRPAPEAAPVRHVIVTDVSLAREFQLLARAHTEDGLASRVRTLQSIREAYPAGRDDAERIRQFLQDAHAQWGTVFVLLGGDDPLVPMRRAHLDQMPLVLGGPDAAIALPTDQYYACLEGDWNADGDERWGESANPGTGAPGDEPDATPELAVGRAPVTTREQARVFVGKTRRALHHGPDSAPLDVLLASGMLFLPPPGAPEMGAQLVHSMWAVVAPLVPHEVREYYYHPDTFAGALPLTPEVLLDALADAPGFAILGGRGEAGYLDTGDGEDPALRVTAEQLYDLHARNGRGHVLLFSASACSPGQSSVGAALVTGPRTGVASVYATTGVSLLGLSSQFDGAYLQELFSGRHSTLGGAQQATYAVFPATGLGNASRLTTLGMTLLGDPALPVPRLGGSPVTSRRGPHASGATPSPARLLELGPNPVVRGTDVRIGGPAVAVSRVEVLDLSGRIVRRLQSSAAGVAPSEANWDLLDERGQRVPGGVYFVRLTSGTGITSRRLVVL